MKLFQLIVGLVFGVHVAHGFYYYSTAGERKCFQKELSKGTVLKGTHELQVYIDEIGKYGVPEKDTISVMIDVEEIFDDNHRVVHQKALPSSEFTFVALDSGEHNICLQSQSKGWSYKPKVKIDVNFEVGFASELDSKATTKVKLLHQKVIQLIAQIDSIKREQKLMREREVLFRDLSEIVNSRATWWGIITLIVLGATCAWQMKHLGSFFVKQKVL